MLKQFSLILTLSIILSGCTVPFLSNIKNSKSGIQVTTTPAATVYLSGNSLGLSPIVEENLKSGTYDLRIVPVDSTISPWETKITLSPGVLTVIDRKLSNSPDLSHGYTMSFEKLGTRSDVKLAVTTIPDSVTVTIDGSPKGFTPISLDNISVGDHAILLTSPGFEDKTVRARTVEGYQLTITAQLAKQPLAPILGSVATPSADLDTSPTPTPSTSKPKPTITPNPTQASTAAVPRPYIEINSTPTGWLRVRSQPNTTSSEVAKVNPGDRFPYLDTQSGWHQIKLSDGTKGWLSGQYSSLLE